MKPSTEELNQAEQVLQAKMIKWFAANLESGHDILIIHRTPQSAKRTPLAVLVLPAPQDQGDSPTQSEYNQTVEILCRP